jgi:large subunit ribosomal protein L23
MAKEIHLFDLIRRPVITEKTNFLGSTLNQYTFEVHLDANKIQIKDAVELIFDVDVERVNTMIVPPKRGRRGRKFYIRKTKWKKAIVTTTQPINLFNT